MINNKIISFMIIFLILILEVMAVASQQNETFPPEVEITTTTTTLHHKHPRPTTTTLITTSTTSTTTTTLPMVICSDNDEGDDPYTAGTVQRRDGLYNYRDRCNFLGNTLTEYFCLPSGHIGSRYYPCMCIMSSFGGYCLSS